MKEINLFGLNYLDKEKELVNSFKLLLKKKNFVKGNEIKLFETKFKKKIKAKYCHSCNSGTDALYLILKTLKLKKNDEIITTSHSWISTSEAIVNAGGKPIFVDTGEDFNIDPNKIKTKITKNTKAMLIVHLFGLPCKMESIIKICRKNRIKLIEDCAQSTFSKYKNKNVGTFGYASAFSFFPTKTLGCFGDGGCIITNNKKVYEKVKLLSNHGSSNRVDNIYHGINSRLDTLQALILIQKLKWVDQELKKKIRVVKFYNNELSKIKSIEIPRTYSKILNTYYLYTIKVKERDKLKKYLMSKGIQSGVYYPLLLPFKKVYKIYNPKPNQFKTSLDNTKKMLSIPLHKDIDLKLAKVIVNQIKFFYEKRN
tara:strand:+ start:793 stop:1899 length:1107 start_codon:yes stop_codon:yes gene_type:complete